MQFKNPLVSQYYEQKTLITPKLQSIEKTLSSRSSISQKQKAIKELEKISKHLNPEEKEMLGRLKEKYQNPNQGVKK
ncbi:hypothetical protein [Helicobacter sp. 13S00477-4]|uniref:hypothetical protein n=1 Tax=Helicobacter sp. 13S00477-4 TaxID=1905759 RepID=UPI00117AD33E|nr:hypothetical protein [Helicobacter sp. 13S00477-4]